MEQTVKVLAVADPAMLVYADRGTGILSRFGLRTGAQVQFDIVPWAQFAPAMKDAFAGKADYDVITICGHMWMFDRIAEGNLDPCDYSPADYEGGDILPAIRAELSLDGTPYLYPSFCDGHMILYRKSIVGELPPQVDAGKLAEIAAGLNCPAGVYPLVLKAHPSEIFLDALPFLREGGRNIVDPKTMRPDFTDQATVRGLETYIGLKRYCPEGTEAFGNDEVREWFAAGKAAIAMPWCGQLGVVLDERCAEPEDVGFATYTRPWNVTWSFGVNAASPRKALAHELCRYLTSKEWDPVAGRRSGAPVRASSYRMGAYPMVERMIADLSSPLPGFAGSGDAYGVLYDEISEAFAGRKTAREALDDAAGRMAGLIRQTSTRS